MRRVFLARIGVWLSCLVLVAGCGAVSEVSTRSSSSTPPYGWFSFQSFAHPSLPGVLHSEPVSGVDARDWARVEGVLDVEERHGLPVYRVGLRVHGQSHSARTVAHSWPDHVTLHGVGTRSGQTRLVARVGPGFDTDDQGWFWSPWTWCGDCVGWENVLGADERFAPETQSVLMDLLSLAHRPSQSATGVVGDIRLVDRPRTVLVEGQALEQVLPALSMRWEQIRQSIAAVPEARSSYQELVDTHIHRPTPSRHILTLCDRFEPPSRTDRVEVANQVFAAWVTCAQEAWSGWDRSGASERHVWWLEQESEAARAARLRDANRFVPTSPEEDERQAFQMVDDVLRQWRTWLDARDAPAFGVPDRPLP